MRLGLRVLTTAGVLTLIASIPATGLARSASLVATSRTASPTVPGKPSASGSPAASASVQLAQAAERNAAAAAAAAAPSTPVMARISVPRIGIRNAPVYDRGLDARGTMLIAPGYSVTRYAFSAPFGSGNTVIYGHNDIQGNIFGHLYDLRAGDTVQVKVAGSAQVYRVIGHKIVAPNALGVLAPTADVRLTIITCWPFNVDTQRWIVTAVKI